MATTMQIFEKAVFEEGEQINYYKHPEWDSKFIPFVGALRFKLYGSRPMTAAKGLPHVPVELTEILSVLVLHSTPGIALRNNGSGVGVQPSRMLFGIYYVTSNAAQYTVLQLPY
jgi:hypothetical protein